MSILKPGEEIFYLPGLTGLKLSGKELPKNADEALACRRAYWRRLKEHATKEDLDWTEQMIREDQRNGEVLDPVSVKDGSYLLLCDRTYLIYANETTLENWRTIQEFFETGKPEELEVQPAEESETYLEDVGTGSVLYEQINPLIPYQR